MEPPTLFEPRSPYSFDAPLSPPLFFPIDAHAQQDADPFSFDDRFSSPDLLTPSSNTDSNESVDALPAYATTNELLIPLSTAGYHEQFATVEPQSIPLTDSYAVIPASSSSASFSPAPSSQSSALSLSMFSAGPARPNPKAVTGPVEIVFPLPAIAKPKRHRTNLSHLSNNERLQHKRARHRQIDASRREREKAAIRRLRLLVEDMTGAAADKAAAAGTTEAEDDEKDKDEDADGVLGNKTDVLEQGITLIEQLRDLCATLQQDNGQAPSVMFTRWPQRGSFSTPAGTPSILHLLPPPNSSLMAHLDRSQTLRASTTVTSPICSLMILFPGAVIMDVSRSFVDFSGYKDEQLIHSRMNPWYLPPASEHNTVCPLLIDDKDERSGRVTKLVGQYGASKSDMGDLIRGELGRLDVDWRYRLADGRLMETKTTGWMEDKDTNEEVTIEFVDDGGQKHTWSSHRTLVRMVFARQDTVEIDKTETRSYKPPIWTTKEVRNGRRTQVFVRPANMAQ